MDRYAIFVDAGYFFAAGGELVHGVPRRERLDVEPYALLDRLRAIAAEHDRGDFLRMYWYDAAINAVPQAEHRRIAEVPGIKLRLGRLTRSGQKGVDSLVVRDMMRLASEHAICTAFLVSGDEDLRQGVIESQDYGVKVVLLGITPVWEENQADTLVWEADVVQNLTRDDLIDCITLRESQRGELVWFDAAPGATEFATAWKRAASPGDIREVVADLRVPAHVDRMLIEHLLRSANLGPTDQLDPRLLADARAVFRRVVMDGEAPQVAASGTAEAPVAAGAASSEGLADLHHAPPPPPREQPETAAPPAPGEEDDPFSPFTIGRRFAHSWLRDAPPGETGYLKSEYPRLPPEVDRQLLRRLVSDLGLPAGALVEDRDRKVARAGFWSVLGFASPEAVPAPGEPIREENPYRFGQVFCDQWKESAPFEEVEQARKLIENRTGLPATVDRELLRAAVSQFGDPVEQRVKEQLRAGFQDALTSLR